MAKWIKSFLECLVIKPTWRIDQCFQVQIKHYLLNIGLKFMITLKKRHICIRVFRKKCCEFPSYITGFKSSVFPLIMHFYADFVSLLFGDNNFSQFTKKAPISTCEENLRAYYFQKPFNVRFNLLKIKVRDVTF